MLSILIQINDTVATGCCETPEVSHSPLGLTSVLLITDNQWIL